MKLDKTNVEDILALTPLQEGILYHYLAQPGTGQYMEQLSLELSGPVDPARLRQAWDRVSAVNPMLRTLFRWENLSHPVQVILARHQPVIRVSRLETGDAESFVAAALGSDRGEPFDLRQPPFRVTLLILAPERSRMLMTSHHILFDGWSSGVLLREFLAAYHDPEVNIPTKTGFKSFLQFLRGRDAAADTAYWRTYLEGYEVPSWPDLAGPGPAPAGRLDLDLTEDLARDLAGAARRLRLTQASLVHAAWGLVMQRYHDSRDVIIGSTVSGRAAAIPGIENMVGLLINTLPLRARTVPETTVADLARAVADDLIAREPRQHAPLVEIRATAGLKAGEELFTSLVAVENYPLESASLHGPDLAVTGHDFSEETHYALSLSYLAQERPRCVITFREGVLGPAAARRLGDHFLAVLTGLAGEPETRVDDIEMLSPAEWHQWVDECNRTERDWSGPELIQSQFEAQAGRWPEREALVWKGGSLTYQALNRRANRLAWRLRTLGLGPDRLAALCLPRSPGMVTATLAVLKAGGAYLPLDPAAPAQRLSLVLSDARPLCLLVAGGLAVEATRLAPGLPILDLDREPDNGEDPGDLPLVNRPDSLAYVIYTSGSTGRPKGVMVEHRAAVNLLRGLQRRFPLGRGDAYLLKTSYTFDVSVTELFGWFFGSGRLAVLGPGLERDPAAILDAVRRHGVTHLNFVPSMLRAFLEYLEGEDPSGLSGLKYLSAGGENLPADLATRFLSLGLPSRLLNLYGPTESAVYATGMDAADDAGAGTWASIGAPLDNDRAYVLGRHGGPQPQGVPGELCLGGVGLCRGYLNNPEANAEKFPADPFRPAKTIYRTGDLACWRQEGRLVCLGRMDHQVKLQGHRVELGEVEEALTRHPALSEAAAVVLGEALSGEGTLCAYYSLRPAAHPDQVRPDVLRRFLAQSLPPYMIPAHFVPMERLPRTGSGKVDRKALPAPDSRAGPGHEQAYAEGTRTVAARIAAIWCEVLNREGVPGDVSFFDLGGHSIALIRVLTRINRAFGLDLPMTQLFAHPTIRDLVLLVERAQAGPLPPSEAKISPAPASHRAGPDPAQAWTPIAIIGMAGRFPGAADVDQLWSNLKAGVESVRFFTPEELRASGVAEGLIAHPDYVPAKGWLADAERFDAAFFAYSDAEAGLMDPQIRLLHECALLALEQAGYDPWRYAGNIGLYAGASPNPRWIQGLPAGAPPSELYEAMILNERDFLCARVAYRLNLRGPAVTLQTACSTSLVAIHQACRSLMSGECDLALAGGVSLLLPPESGYLRQPGMIHSPDGHCRPFDAGANGTVGGDGVGLVALKRLDLALTEDDPIHAVIQGGWVNNDGSAKVGYTAPAVAGQAEVIRRALALAGVDPERIGYLEAHGTGTPLGDPVEVAALKSAFATDERGYCALGSVKANLGHLDAAAGVAGMIKAALAIEHGIIPPSVNYRRPNPGLELGESPFRVVTSAEPWPEALSPRRAGVSSFGIGGTNAHLVLSQAPAAPEHAGPAPGPRLLRLSARTPEALAGLARRMADHLAHHPDTHPDDLAFTLNQGRRAWGHRLSLVFRDPVEAREGLAAVPSPGSLGPVPDDPAPIFVFPGQGAQHVNMGRGLYEAWPALRREIDRCLTVLEGLAGESLGQTLYPGNPESFRAAPDRIDQTGLAQPLLFTLEYALASALMSLGIRPRAMIGHSLGEYVAACLSGVFSLEDGLQVVLWRGRAMQALAPGSMAALALSREAASALLAEFGAPGLSLAAVNSPTACVVSGPSPEIDAFTRFAADRGAASQRLHTSHAFHSAMMEPIMSPLAELLAGIRLQPPILPFASNLHGRLITPAEATDPAYWAAHLRRTVEFSSGVAALLGDGAGVWIEVGPGAGLTSRLLEHTQGRPNQAVVSLLRHPRESTPDLDQLLKGLGRLWCLGLEPAGDVPGLNPAGRRIPLPGYPFAGKRYPARIGHVRAAPVPATGPIHKRPEVEQWLYAPVWRETPAPAWSGTGHGPEEGDCLILADAGGIGHALAAELSRLGQRTILVRAGVDFRALGQDEYQVPAGPHGQEALWRALERDARPVRRLVDLRTLDRDEAAQPIPAAENLPGPAFREFLHTLQALGPRCPKGGLSLTLVGRGLCRVGTESGAGPRPELAMLRGLCLVAGQEHPGLYCRAVDLDPEPVQGWRAEVQVRDLAAEVWAAAGEPLAAWRDGRRWVEDYPPLPVPESQADLNGPVTVRPGGVYLVIGGLGTIGLALAGHLASIAGVRLALCVRTPLPPRNEWPARLKPVPAQDPDRDPVALRLAGVLALETLGAEVRTYSADAGDEEALRALARRVMREWGPLHGVIHAAGEGFGRFFRPLARIDEDYLQRQVSPRLRQARALQSLVREFRPAWCVTTSSLSTVLGGLGLAGYAGANHYLDALADREDRTGATAWLNIAWDGWRPAGNESLPQSGIQHLLISAEEGRRAFAHILARGRPGRVVVSSGDLGRRLEQWVFRRHAATVEAGPQGLSPSARTQDSVRDAVALIWRQVLGLEAVDSRDNFFTLGGDSLKAITVLSRIRAGLGLDMPLPDFMACPTLGDCIARLVPTRPADLPPIKPAAEAETYPLSSAQERLYVLHQMDPDDTSHNETYSLLLEGELFPERLKSAAERLLDRHESLRTGIETDGEGPHQRIHDRVSLEWNHHPDGDPASDAAGILPQPFDLARPPLLRLDLARLGPDRHLLRVDIHHIITDGSSHAIFLRDLLALYAGRDLPPLRLQYKDYARWQQQVRRDGLLRLQEEYWLARFADRPQPLRLPTDFPRPRVHGFVGRSVRFALDPKLTAGLRRVQADCGATTFTTLLALYAVLLSQYSGQEDLVIGAPVGGRTQPGLEDMIGMFVNLVALRCRLPAEESFAGFLSDLNRTTFDALANQDYPFEELVTRLGLQGSLDRHPLFNVLFTLQNRGEAEVTSAGLTCRLQEAVEVRTHFDLTLMALESPVAIDLTLEYSPALFRGETIQGIIERFLHIAHQVAADPRQRLGDLCPEHGLASIAAPVEEEDGDFGF